MNKTLSHHEKNVILGDIISYSYTYILIQLHFLTSREAECMVPRSWHPVILWQTHPFMYQDVRSCNLIDDTLLFLNDSLNLDDCEHLRALKRLPEVWSIYVQSFSPLLRLIITKLFTIFINILIKIGGVLNS